MISHSIHDLVFGKVHEAETPFSPASSQIGQLRSLSQVCSLRALTILKWNELLHLLLTVDALVQTKAQNIQIGQLDGIFRQLGWLTQSPKAGKLQYLFPPNFHRGGAMLLHLTEEATVFITRLMGSTKIYVALKVTGISLVHSVCWHSTAWHFVTDTVAPFLVI